jgi:hypothetical protein
VKARWILVALAIAGAAAFAISVQAGRWWAVEGFEIGPGGSYRCFGGECRAAGLGWVGGDERWVRLGSATWAAGVIAMAVLLVVAGAVAARRAPRLAARTGLVATATAAVAGGLFFAQFPGVQGASVDRGLWWFGIAIALSTAACIGALRIAAPPALRAPGLGR